MTRVQNTDTFMYSASPRHTPSMQPWRERL